MIRPLLGVFLIFVFASALIGDDEAKKPEEKSKAERRKTMFFEQHIRPLLVTHCQKCHGEKKQQSGLPLNSRADLFKGGELGEAIDLQNPAESLLISALRYESLEMPPDGKLADKQIELFELWIKMGAPWPGNDGGATTKPSPSFTAAERSHWAFQPVKRPELPQLSDDRWSRNPIDLFVLQKLRAEKLTPAAAAEPAALVRRLYYTVIGLPPSPDEIDAFVRDPSPEAYARLVDQLLDRPEFGEKWARHWLDLVRYAESDGYKQDAYRPHAWRYRDYVIRSLNNDKPYNRFVQEQLAGDELAPHDRDAVVATGYLRHWIYEYNQRDVRTQWDNILNDVTDVTADVFLGMGLGCARCHDHKFDPILRKDYYRIRAFFAPLSPRYEMPVIGKEDSAARDKRQAEWEQATAEIRSQIDIIQRPHIERVRKAAADKFPLDIRPMIMAKAKDRTPFEQQLADMAWRQLRTEVEKIDYAKQLKGEGKKRWEELQKQLATFDSIKPKPLTDAMIATDVGPLAPVNSIPDDPRNRDIAPGFLSILDAKDVEIKSLAQTTGRRSVLAKWITSDDNPLSTRVIVNRIWQYHFGRGLVETSSDFGTLGQPPTHPELLDWLTSEFVAGGWKMKQLHRQILNSATFRQSALRTIPPLAKQVDPGNRLYWRMNVRRLEAEQIRDAMLAISGELRRAHAGASVDDSALRRSIYSKSMRNNPDSFLRAFDGTDGFFSTATRNITTTPTQSLLMINSKWTLDRARAMAIKLRKDESETDGQIVAAFRRAVGRYPADDEMRAAVRFLREQREQFEAHNKPVTGPFAKLPGRTDSALNLGPPSGLSALSLSSTESLPQDEFTVEVTFLLRSLYPDATVRTLASQWDNNKAHAGWALGVTSTKSAYQPRNLIVQLIGKDSTGKMKYEVVASNLRPELNRPYRAVVRIQWKNAKQRIVDFELHDLHAPNAKPQQAAIQHSIESDLPGSLALTLGGRHNSTAHRWDGLLDDVKLHAGPQLTPKTVAHWQFDSLASLLKDSLSKQGELTAVGAVTASDSALEALVDLCHALLNSNETLYLD